jgi:DNA-binding Lrp family transcriptional regulator
MLDPKDVEILKILTYNSRTSYSDIAASVGLTVNAVKSRIKEKLESNAIESYLAIPNFAILGFKTSHALLIKHDGDASKVADQLSSLGYVYMQVDFSDETTLLRIFGKKDTIFSTDAVNKMIKPYEVVRRFDERLHTDFVPSITDLKIIRCLILDPRMRITELATTISMSEKTVTRRLEVISKNHVLDFTIQYNLSSMTHYFYSRIIVIVEQRMHDVVLRQIISKFKNHLLCPVPPSSESMISLILYSKNIPEIEEVKKKIRSVKGVVQAISRIPVSGRFDQKHLIREIDRMIESF